MNELLSKVRQLPSNSIVMVTSYNADADKITYSLNEAVRLVSKVANAPVFVYSDTAFGEGAVGGYLISFMQVGEIAGKTAVDILKGTDIGSIKVIEKDYYGHIFDWRVLKRWQAEDTNFLPKGAKVMFRKATFLETYRWFIIFGGKVPLGLDLSDIENHNVISLFPSLHFLAYFFLQFVLYELIFLKGYKRLDILNRYSIIIIILLGLGFLFFSTAPPYALESNIGILAFLRLNSGLSVMTIDIILWIFASLSLIRFIKEPYPLILILSNFVIFSLRNVSNDKYTLPLIVIFCYLIVTGKLSNDKK